MSVNSMPEESLRHIGKYRIIGTLGRGSMGVVYKAEDPEIGRLVAIKTLRTLLPGQFQEADTVLNRFAQEARSAGNLRHPNIITIFEVNRDGNTPYMVMDYIEGEGLDQVIENNGRVDVGLAIHYLTQVAAGLDHAHSKGVIHRDIKSSNILVDRSGNAFILDFGVATISTGPLAPSGPVLGTPAYMAPEQILNEPLDNRADLFSFAVVAFECLTGTRPFIGENFTQVIGNIVSGNMLLLTKVVPQFAPAAEETFKRALAKDRDVRYASASEIVKNLALALDAKHSAVRIHQPGALPVDQADPLLPKKRKRSSSSKWKRVRERKYSDVDVKVSSDEEPERKRKTTEEMLTPWANTGGQILSPSGSKAIQESARSRPGQSLFGDSAVIGKHADKSQHGSSSSKSVYVATLALGALSIIAAAGIGYFLLLEPKDKVLTQNPTQPAKVEAAPIAIAETGTVVEDLLPPDVDPVPDDKRIYEMSDRELLGVLVGGGVADDLVLEALQEAYNRRTAGLIEACVIALKNDSYVVRIETVQLLAKLKDKRSIPYMLELLDDHDPLVRAHTAKALGVLGDKRAVGYLSSRLTKEVAPEVRDQIRQSIDHINGYPG